MLLDKSAAKNLLQSGMFPVKYATSFRKTPHSEWDKPWTYISRSLLFLKNYPIFNSYQHRMDPMLPRVSLLTLALFQIQNIAAAHAQESYPADYHSRLTGQFLAGHNQQLGSFVDLMAPISKGVERFLFADGTVMFGQNQRTAYSGGVGYRGILNGPTGSGIGGAYVFADYYHSDFKTTQWFLNPGVEWLGVHYEARLQAYIPLSAKNKVYGSTLASELPGNVTAPSGKAQNLNGATGHRIFDTPVHLIEEYGSGVEIEAGRFFEIGKGAWVRVGAYHFNYQNVSNINGVQANLEGIVNRNISVILQNNYDNQNKNRFSIGLRVSFGGSDAPVNTLASRLTSPIIRHQARQSYGQVEPTWQTYKASGPSFDLFGGSSGIGEAWFFSPRGSAPPGSATTLENCTAEHPCRTVDTPTAARIQELSAGANLLFETGNYVIPNSNSNNLHWVNLQDGQSILGRNQGWESPATPANRPLIEGGLFWGNFAMGNTASGKLSNTNVTNNNQSIPSAFTGLASDSVIAVGARGNLEASQSNVTAEASINNIFVPAVGMFSGNNLLATNTQQTVRATALNEIAEGFAILAGNNATVRGSISNVEVNGLGANAVGISGSQVVVNSSEQEITANGSIATANAVGIRASNDATVDNTITTVTADGFTAVRITGIKAGASALVENSAVQISSFSSTDTAQADGVSSELNTTVSNSSITADASGETGAVANGISALGDANISTSSLLVLASSQTISAIANGVAAKNATATDAAFGAGAVLEAGNSAQAIGINADDAIVVTNVATFGIARVISGNGFAQVYGMNADNITAINIIQDCTSLTDSGEAIAYGANALVQANITGATQDLASASVSGAANSRGIVGTDVTVTDVISEITSTVLVGNGNATIDGVFAGAQVTASHLTQTLTATAADGNAAVIGLQSPGNASLTDVTQTVEANSSAASATGLGVLTGGEARVNGGTQNITVNGVTDVTAIGISANGDAIVSDGMRNASATSTTGIAIATGISSGNTTAVDSETITATANGNAGTAAIGVSAIAGDVTNTQITASGNGTNIKCLGATSPDGSC
jgi:hypothetical protein